MLVGIENVSKDYGGDRVLSGITARILEGDKIGVVGSNGAGKTTLLRLIAEELDCDEGSIEIASGLSIGYQRQNSGLDMTGTLIDELKAPFKDLYDTEAELQQVAEQLKAGAADELLERYSALEHRLIAADWYSLDYRINMIVNGVGLSKLPMDTLVSSMSGGEQTMLMLARLLLLSPMLLILDEPTNHLDMNALIWLEDYLKKYNGAVLVVSHDRFFLDKVCNRIWNISGGRLTAYTGNYTEYQRRYSDSIEQHEKLYRQYLEKKQQLEDYIARNIVRAATTKQAQSRRKELEKLEETERPRFTPRPPRLRLSYTIGSAEDVLELAGCDIKSPVEKIILSGVNLRLRRGEKLAIIGANGTGKTTLLKLLVSGRQPSKGRIEWGRSVRYSYYEQGSEGMELNISVLDSLHKQYPAKTEYELRSVLGAMGLSGEMVYRMVGELSGGERARLKLSEICMADSNVLILDEPTNHLDLGTKEVLEEALLKYTGTIIMVSHDRYLLDRVATKIMWLHDSGADVIDGGYSAYLKLVEGYSEIKAEQAQKPSQDTASKQHYTGGKEARRRQAMHRRAVVDTENLIAELEEKIKEIDLLILQPEIASDYIKLTEVCENRNRLEQDLERAMEKWASLEQ